MSSGDGCRTVLAWPRPTAPSPRARPRRPGAGERQPPGQMVAGLAHSGPGLRPRPVDMLVVWVIAYVQISEPFGSQDEPSPWAFDAVAVIPLVVGPVALLFRRRWPEATLAVAFVAAAVSSGPQGLDEETIAFLVQRDADLAAGVSAEVTDDLRRLIGHPTTPLVEGLRALHTR
jgi:hypothetical protein